MSENSQQIPVLRWITHWNCDKNFKAAKIKMLQQAIYLFKQLKNRTFQQNVRGFNVREWFSDYQDIWCLDCGVSILFSASCALRIRAFILSDLHLS
jgi:hypothetical protein